MFVDLLIRFGLQLVLLFFTMVLVIIAWFTFKYVLDWLIWRLGLFYLKGFNENEERRYWSQKEAVVRARRLLYQEKNKTLNLKDNPHIERKIRLINLKEERKAHSKYIKSL